VRPLIKERASYSSKPLLTASVTHGAPDVKRRKWMVSNVSLSANAGFNYSSGVRLSWLRLLVFFFWISQQWSVYYRWR